MFEPKQIFQHWGLTRDGKDGFAQHERHVRRTSTFAIYLPSIAEIEHGLWLHSKSSTDFPKSSRMRLERVDLRRLRFYHGVEQPQRKAHCLKLALDRIIRQHPKSITT